MRRTCPPSSTTCTTVWWTCPPKELAKRWYRAAFAESPDKHGGHRALADILESIQELEYYRRVLFPAEPVTTERAREVAREVVALGIPAMGEAAEA